MSDDEEALDASAVEANAPPRGDGRAPGVARSMIARVAWTLAPIAALFAGRWAELPGIDHARIERVGAPHPTVGAIGILPLLAAVALVEMVVALVPSWAPERHRGADARRRISRFSVLVATAIAAVQAYGLVTFYAGAAILASGPLIPGLTLVAGFACTVAIAELASRRGLGNGYVTILVTGIVGSYFEKPHAGEVPLLPIENTAVKWLVLAAGAIAVVAATALALRGWLVPTTRERALPRDAGYRATESPPPPRVLIPAPASGLAPLYLVPVVITLPATLTALKIPGFHVVPELPDLAWFAIGLALVALFGALFASLQNDPVRVAIVAARAAGGKQTELALSAARPMVRAATLHSVLYLCAIFVLDQVVGKVAAVILAGMGLANIVALVLDVRREVAFRRSHPDATSIWPEHRPYAAEQVADALGRAGIPVLLRNRNQRVLLQFFAAYVPIDVCVPAKDMERATEIARRILAPRKNDAKLREKLASAQPEPQPLAGTERLGAALALVMAAGAAGIIVPTVLHEEPHRAHKGRRTKLEFVTVDDEADPLRAFAHGRERELPPGVHVLPLNGYVGSGRTNVVYRAEIRPVDGESIDAALDRTRAFFEALDVPAEDRIGFESLEEYDDEGRSTPVGYRTLVLARKPVLDENDITDAVAASQPDEGIGPHWVVHLEFTPSGAETFERYTGSHVGTRFAIVADGAIVSAPVIQSKIGGGSALITMGRGSSVDEQRKQAIALAAGLAHD